ncbi:MAG: hypothetical protein J6U23_00650 [Clostridiales bacterium]|nr:hypothetical protein [Clostridiales bacterium]
MKKILLICYILASIFAVIIFSQVLLSIGIKATGTDVFRADAALKMSQATDYRGYQTGFFIPALVCGIIGSISCLVKYKRGLVVAMGLVTVFDLLAMVYMAAFAKDFLIDKLMFGLLFDKSLLKAAGIDIVTQTGPCFYLAIIAAAVLAVITILIFIKVPADKD